jgi:radical SAM superfamily enzyme YgiQ (UPF0313 family)
MAVNGKKPKVVLFHPENQKGKYPTCQRQPLDILSISGFPEQRGYEVVIIDASVMSDYRERIIKECEDALCFGTTSMIGYRAYNAYSMGKEVKEKYPSLPVVAGGWYPSVKPDMFLEQGGADIVVMRQGEFTFMELLEALRSGSSFEGIEGLAYNNNGEVVFTPPREVEDINKMPSMPYHLINLEDYFASDPYDRVKRFLFLATGEDFSSERIRALDYVSSYGCPDACTFCASPTLLGRKWTALETDRVLDELEHLQKQHQFNVLTFSDANWGVSEKRVIEFCEGLLERGIKLYWTATIEAHVLNKFDTEVVDLMAKSGCFHLFFGAESGYPQTLKQIQKNIKPGDVFQALETCCSRGVIPETSYIVGFPGESVESIQATIEESCEVVYRWPKVDVPIVFLLPIPSTPLHEDAVKVGYESPTSMEYWSGYVNIGAEFYASLNPSQAKSIRRCQPELFSSINYKQLKAISWMKRYYFHWGAEVLKVGKKLNFLEKILYVTSRLRLKYKILGFPIEFKIYGGLRRLLNAFR